MNRLRTVLTNRIELTLKMREKWGKNKRRIDVL